MLHYLRSLFNWSNKPSDEVHGAGGDDSNGADDFARLNRAVPLQTADDKQNSFVRREAMLDRAEKIAGYEFSLLTTLKARLHRRGGMAKRAYDAALLTRLGLHGVTSLLGHRLAFISLSVESLNNALIDQLPPQNTVLILEVAQHKTDWDAVGARLADLKQKGFSLGLMIHDVTDMGCPLTSQLDFIQIDVTAFDGIDLKALTADLRKTQPVGTSYPQLVARDVQSHDDFQFCNKCGFDLFQGPFVTSRESFHAASGGVNRIAVLPILNMVRSDQSFALIADQLKNEPTLSYKLLRYLNSPAMGLQQPIDNLTQALVLIGREKFYRWMSLLLFDFSNPTYRERALAERALVRGRTLELLAGKGRIPSARDHLFLIGLFSLLDVALGRPLPELLEKATLPDAVRDALLGNAGVYADALALAVLGEADATASQDQMAQALQCCGITDALYTPSAAAALVWANQALGDAA
jgi:EAL and modified HD-GYP domain-containing signal transduction protein